MYNRLFRIFPERIVKLTFFREIKYAARTYCKVRGGLQRGHSLHLGPLDPRPLHAEAGGQLGGVRQLLRYSPSCLHAVESEQPWSTAAAFCVQQQQPQ